MPRSSAKRKPSPRVDPAKPDASAKRRGYEPRRFSAAEKTKAAKVFAILAQRYPDATCALEHGDPWQLLVATILSAQCTDERVNKVTPALFEALPTPQAMADVPQEALERLIHSTGFFRNKAKNLIGAAKSISNEFGGQVPKGMDDLMRLPGVARKTANVVRGVAYGIAEGVVVDTHVFRLSHRLGWTKAKDPEKVERDLMALFPQARWIDLAHVLIWHGRDLCVARRPKCEECPVNRLCPSSLV